MGDGTTAGVYVQTNDAGGNQVIAFRRDDDGGLTRIGTYDTRGRGSGKPHLASQGSVVLSGDGGTLLVVNAGSGELCSFKVAADGGLELVGHVSSGGELPTSVTEHDGLVYVLNAGAGANVSGFRIVEGGGLAAIADSIRQLSRPEADPAQVAFSPDGRTLVVTERGTDSISTFTVAGGGYLEGPSVHASSGATPYGFDFTESGTLVVTEAFGGEVGKAAASSYTTARGFAPISGSVANTRSEVCWAVVSKDGRFAYVTNFGDGTISSYAIEPDGRLELADAVAASTNLGEKGVRDEALTSDGRFLYALDADAQKVYGWRVEDDGRLAPVGDADGLPATVAGLAAA